MTEIPAKGHTEVVDADVEPTCTETGLTEGKHCSVCKEVLVAQDVFPAKGHSYGEWIIDKEPTCTEDGAKHKVCSVCDDEVSETIDKLGHDWAEDFTVDKEATCTEAGSKSKHCSRCSEKSEVTEIPARGHLDMDGDGKCDACDCDYEDRCDCICHNDSIWSKIVRFIYTLFSKIFHKRIACCEDMEFWGGEIKDLT